MKRIKYTTIFALLVTLFSVSEQHAWSWNGVKELVSSMQKKTFMVGAAVGAMAGYYLAKQRSIYSAALKEEVREAWCIVLESDAVRNAKILMDENNESTIVEIRDSCKQLVKTFGWYISTLQRMIKNISFYRRVLLFSEVQQEIRDGIRQVEEWINQINQMAHDLRRDPNPNPERYKEQLRIIVKGVLCPQA